MRFDPVASCCTRLTENIFGSGSLHDVLITFSRYRCSRGQENDVFLEFFRSFFVEEKRGCSRRISLLFFHITG